MQCLIFPYGIDIKAEIHEELGGQISFTIKIRYSHAFSEQLTHFLFKILIYQDLPLLSMHKSHHCKQLAMLPRVREVPHSQSAHEELSVRVACNRNAT